MSSKSIGSQVGYYSITFLLGLGSNLYVRILFFLGLGEILLAFLGGMAMCDESGAEKSPEFDTTNNIREVGPPN